MLKKLVAALNKFIDALEVKEDKTNSVYNQYRSRMYE
ncbi:hypothetical protein IJ22_33580 [Paenibacillus naphthalenovorans]|uniref:Uncharacterized protein n=1 Tax=Paenibacillus naphthalenovorans TaxID=162209 RepID=A0A0U2VW58_9BACL|nr:hypothetical protein IJ22_33580 [Paenibacillus naphthalenovorans]SDJ36458.1 hypothetical protein SAMN05421868_1251 [Paenibacillus naphthalenovorans]